MLTESNTYTFTTTDDCSHDNYTFRKVVVNFYLFELTMLYRVCHKCHKLIKDHAKWKIKINKHNGHLSKLQKNKEDVKV